MKIYFVRHGETPSNKLGRVMSRSNDEPLSEEGLEFVKKVAQDSNLDFDIVFSSPLKRASETAAEFAKTKNLAVHFHDGALECEFGTLSNKTWPEIKEMTNGGLTHELWHSVYEFDFSPYGGETKESIKDRIKGFLKHIKENHSSSRPLVATHGGVLRTLYALYPHVQLRKMGNVSIHEFEI